MDLIPVVQQILLIVAIIFIVVLIVSYVYTKFIKKDKDEELPSVQNKNMQTGSNNVSVQNKRTLNYTASADSQKLYVNTDEHRKHVVTNKIASKPKRFQVINKTKDEE